MLVVQRGERLEVNDFLTPVALELETPWANGTTHVVLSFDEVGGEP